MATESEIQKQIVDYLTLVGCTVIRINSGSLKLGSGRVRLAEAGTPDLLAITPTARHVWIEVKTAKGALREAQRAWIEKHLDRGCDVIVARSLEDVRGIAS